MPLDSNMRARLSLFGLLAALLLCTAATSGVHRGMNLVVNWGSGSQSRGRTVGPKGANDVYAMQQLAELQHRALTTAELHRVLKSLDGPKWLVAATALRVLELHHYPQCDAARRHLLQRAGTVMKAGPVAVQSREEWIECVGVIHTLMDFYETSTDSASGQSVSVPRGPSPSLTAKRDGQELAQLWADLALNSHDGSVRARALSMLAHEAPRDLQQIVLAAMTDSSERVCLVALEVVARNRWQAAASRVNQLASSPRPELRRRAAEVQELLGFREEPREYGECVMRAAHRLADRFEELGIDLTHSEQSWAGQPAESVIGEGLSRIAEAYLDRVPDTVARELDFQGVLLLAAAARAGQRKLTLRLWDYEISRTDADDDLFDHALQTVARSQLLAGLAALRREDQAAALEAMSAVARLSRHAVLNPSLHAYVKQANMLSSAIWQGKTVYAQDPAKPVQAGMPDSVARVVDRVLDQLDLSRPEHRDEARRRIDQWCGSESPQPMSARNSHKQPLAN